MPIDITDQLRRIVYFGNDTTGPFSFPFEIINDTDLGVYVNDTPLTITSDYIVEINADGTGEITLVIGSTLSVEPTGTDSIGIFGNKGIQRQTDFTTGGDLFANSLNDEFDAQTIFAQQNSEAVQRSLRAPITDPTDINMLLPSKNDRKGTVLAFDSTTGAPEAGPVIADLLTVAEIKDDITTVANFIDDDNYVLKNSDALLNTLEVNSIKNTGSVLAIGSSAQIQGAWSLYFGNSGSFSLRQNTTTNDAYITNTDNGATTHIKSAIVSLEGDNNETLLTATQNQGVDLYYDGDLKFTTNNTGIELTGNIKAASGTIGIVNPSNQTLAEFDTSGRVTLKFQDSQKLRTTSSGISVYGNVSLVDNSKFICGLADDLQIYHDGTNNYIDGDADLYIRPKNLENGIIVAQDGSISLYYDNALKLQTNSTGVDIYNAIDVNSIGNTGSTLSVTSDASFSSNVSVTGNITISGTVDGVDVSQIPSTYVNVSGDTMTGTLTLNADPTSSLHAATKSYVDTIAAAGIHYHTPVRVESPIALTVTYDNGTDGVGATLTNAGTLAAITIDGIALSLTDRVLIYAQTDATQNGIYTVTTVGDASTAWVLTRATDADSYGVSDKDALGEGDAYFVKEGNTGAGELYVMNTSGVITFGTTDITFSQIAETAVYTAGTNLTLDGTTFNVDDAFVSNTGDAITGDLSFGDNNKAIFGADNDLQIYHDGAGAPAYYNYIESSRPLAIKATSTGAIQIQDSSGNKYANFALGAANLYHGGSSKFVTTSTGIDVTGNIAVSGTVDGRDVATDGTKLDGIEANADVTDTANVTAAGALMDSEVTNLAQVKAFDSADYATAAQGTTADSALQNVVEDTTPQLGGDLDLNSSDITGTGNIDISGNLDVDTGTIKLDGNYPVGLGNIGLGLSALSSVESGGAYNIAIGQSSLTLATTGTFNICIGGFAGDSITTASNNVAIGHQALIDNETGNSNTAIGTRALANVTANSNTSVGTDSSFSITSGTSNVAVGVSALYNNGTQSENTAIGYQSLGQYNYARRTAVGYRAGYYNGADSTYIGNVSGYYDRYGTYNTFIGKNAGYGSFSYTGASYNVAVGASANNTSYGADYTTAVGYNAGYSTSTNGEQCTYVGYRSGYTAASNYNTGVGSQALYDADANFNVGVGFEAGKYLDGLGNTAIGSRALNDASITGSYNIGIGYDSALSALSASNECQIGAPSGVTGQITRLDVGGCDFSMNTTALYYGAEIRAGGDIVAYYSSDINLKENIQNIPDALSKVNAIRGVTYDWKDDYLATKGKQDDYFNRKHDVGVIAQEVEAVLPEVVAERKDGTKAVRYEKLTALLIEAVNDLTTEVKTLKAELEELKNGIS